jgi:hypothetical protein
VSVAPLVLPRMSAPACARLQAMRVRPPSQRGKRRCQQRTDVKAGGRAAEHGKHRLLSWHRLAKHGCLRPFSGHAFLFTPSPCWKTTPKVHPLRQALAPIDCEIQGLFRGHRRAKQ